MKPNDEGGSLKNTIDKKTKNKLNDIFIFQQMGEREKREGRKEVHQSLIIASSRTCAAPIGRGQQDASNAALKGSVWRWDNAALGA